RRWLFRAPCKQSSKPCQLVTHLSVRLIRCLGAVIVVTRQQFPNFFPPKTILRPLRPRACGQFVVDVVVNRLETEARSNAFSAVKADQLYNKESKKRVAGRGLWRRQVWGKLVDGRDAADAQRRQTTKAIVKKLIKPEGRHSERRNRRKGAFVQ